MSSQSSDTAAWFRRPKKVEGEPGPERRSDPRYELVLPVKVGVALPDSALQPPPLKGRSINFSLSGISVNVEALPRGLYRQLLSERRYVRVTFTNPRSDERVRVMGLVVAFDCQMNPAEATAPCTFRICFEEGESGDISGYGDFIRSLER